MGNKLTTEFLPKLQQVIHSEVNNIFDSKLPAFIERVNKAALDLEDHAAEDAEKVIDYATNQMSNLIENTLNHIQDMIHSTEQEVIKAMDDFVENEIGGLMKTTFDFVDTTLTRIESDVQHLVCEATGVVAQMEQFIGLSVDSLDCECALQVKTHNAEPCECTCDARPAKMSCHCNPAEWITVQDQLAYEYIQCKQRKPIESGQLTVDQIIERLENLRRLGEELRCFHATTEGEGSTSSAHYTDSVFDMTKEIYIWRNGVNNATINGTMMV